MDAEKIAAAIELLDALTAAERVEAFDRYCVYCGDIAPTGCQCMNDE